MVTDDFLLRVLLFLGSAHPNIQTNIMLENEFIANLFRFEYR